MPLVAEGYLGYFDGFYSEESSFEYCYLAMLPSLNSLHLNLLANSLPDLFSFYRSEYHQVQLISRVLETTLFELYFGVSFLPLAWTKL